ncbi:sensor histidine kinase [Flagellimonas amoyensis]|uniref:sensor histidine kinase n=1 Tax=Flagellimonas amoyensis TaxID=2169401 RepID=UPI000D34BAB6|nr:histidine kinase [Allomuricauda amoyensis]
MAKKESIAWLIAFTFIGSYLTSLIIFPLPILKSLYRVPLDRILMDIVVNFLFCAAIVILCLFIDAVLNKRMSWMARPVKRLFIQVFLQILSVLMLVVIFGSLYLTVWDPTQIQSSQTNLRLSFYSFLSIVCWALLISTINTGAYMLRNWRATSIKAMEYKLLAAQNGHLASELELQALKLQLDPHFVFNNLSALSELILKDQRLGYEYTENFTKVYRYLLVNSKRKLIPLSEEMKFLRSYQFLIKHRLGKGCRFQVDIDESRLDLMIPPMSLQLLIENALKHNRIEENNPLVIHIHLDDTNGLVVSNKILPLARPTDSLGMGLKNIYDRYTLMGQDGPVIEKDNKVFKVKISLFK